MTFHWADYVKVTTILIFLLVTALVASRLCGDEHRLIIFVACIVSYVLGQIRQVVVAGGK